MELDDLPFPARVHHRMVRTFASRISTDLEWSADYCNYGLGLEIVFFAPRAPLQIEINTVMPPVIRADTMAYEVDGAMVDMDFCERDTMNSGMQRSRLHPARLQKTNRIVIAFNRFAEQSQMRVNVWVAGRRHPRDLKLLQRAQAHLRFDEAAEAVSLLREYEAEYSHRNPSVAYWLANTLRTRRDYDAAEEAAVRALVHGNFDVCIGIYQDIQKERRKRPLQELRDLQWRGRKWGVGAQHGFLVLEKNQTFLLGFDGHYLKKSYEIVEVRRAAAARLLREMEFLISAHHEALVHTSVRVLHANDDIEDLPLEHFRIADSERKNLFIAHEDQRAGHWILPDLAPGDLIEWKFDLLCREGRLDGQPSSFILTSLFHEYFPTLRAQCEFIAPNGSPLHITTRNLDVQPEKKVGPRGDCYSLAAEQFLPARRTGFVFENHYLNPLLACSINGQSWAEVSRAALRTNFGELNGADLQATKLPKPLADIVEQASSPLLALEQAFYWVRDNLKYASFLSGKKQIGETNRAEKIIEAGVGDCNDKSYLLHLVCTRLQIPCDFILVSTASGVLFEDLPADQFDHVFLRARHEDRCIYLDAANQLSVFGSAPQWCQGMRTVVLDDAGTRETIQLDAPATNRIDIHETFAVRQDGWLRGTFDFQAQGQNGRLFDERWKAMSLSVEDQLQAAQDCLRTFLPAATIDDFDLHSHTGSSSLFHISGKHARCRLATLGGSHDEIGTLTWDFPMLPLQYWRTLQIDKLFVFDLPMTIHISVTLEDEIIPALADMSSLSNLETGFCTVQESVSRQAGSCQIHRSIEIRQRFIEEPDVARVPETLEHFERALQLVLRLGSHG